jgi:hypothetical protein
MTPDDTSDYLIPEPNQFTAITSFRIGVCAFFGVDGDRRDTPLYDNAPTLQDIIDKLPSFNTYGDRLDVTTSDELVDPKDFSSQTATGLREPVRWLTAEEEYVAGQHDAITVVCVEGRNNADQPAYAYFSVRLERLNAIYAWVRRGYLYTMPFGRRVQEGVGMRDRDVVEVMFDSWLFLDDRIVIKIIRRKAGS